MSYSFHYRFVAFVMLLVMLMLATTGFCQESGEKENFSAKSVKSVNSNITTLMSAKTDHAFPDQNSDDGNRCDACRYCACHAPLISQSVHVTSPTSQRRVITSLEPFKVLPEVYLSIFIPPQNIV